MRRPTTAFVTVPIAVLAVGAFTVVLGSLLIGARETDSIALTQQRATIEHALKQHGLALARELRVQTVWAEAYEKTLAGDTVWMRAFYGQYLNDLFGYDAIYVLSSNDRLVFGFANGRDKDSADFSSIAPDVGDLVAAVRNAADAPEPDVITTPIDFADGQSVQHRAVADVRRVLGKPATVVVSTIVPDRSPRTMLSSPYLLIAIEDLDARFISTLGTNFGFRSLAWIEGAPSVDMATDLVKAKNGTDVGTLAWRKDQPGWQFVQRASAGLLLALALLAVLALILMRWGRQKANQILASEADARHAARTDTLTGLPNRAALGEMLSKMLEQTGDSTLGILAIDLNQFGEINDDFGNAMGDAVLLAVAQRLRTLLPTDAVLARPDGDEFMVLAPRMDAGEVANLATSVTSALSTPIDVKGRARVYVSAAVGYALAPSDGEQDDDLMRRVELALAKAKAHGGATAIAFAPEMDLELSRRRAIESALRDAVAKEAIDVVYQPIMDPTGTRVVCVEALARWTDPLLGPVSPEVFVPIAEENGLIPRIGEIVLRRAVADGRAWPDIDVAVNVSGAQIHHGDIVSVAADALATFKFPPHRLVIEITETVLLVDEKRADDQIRRLQELGVKVALDDFGSGYSSLLYLRKFGFDKLKIDRGFIEAIGHSDDSTLILASIIRLGLDLKLVITAEGVETAEQRRWLAASGCHELQGYLFSRPLAAEQVTAFLSAHRHAVAG
jgi:diguanylate cyclase (GGDEF)-like protein